MNQFIIILIAIAFATVSSNPNELGVGVCSKSVNNKWGDSTHWSYSDCQDHWFRESIQVQLGKFCIGKSERYAITSVEIECCEGYEKKDLECLPRCLPECKIGHYCAEPNECRICRPGQTGKTCEEKPRPPFYQNHPRTRIQDVETSTRKPLRQNKPRTKIQDVGTSTRKPLSQIDPKTKIQDVETSTREPVPQIDPKTKIHDVETSTREPFHQIDPITKIQDVETSTREPLRQNDQMTKIQRAKISSMDDSTHDHLKNITCPYGWQGESCSESLFCVIIDPAEADVNEVQMNHRINEDPFFDVQNRTECLQTCLTTSAVKVTQISTEYTNMTYYLVPIESPCNIETDSKYPIIIGSLVILLLAIIIVCIVWVMQRKRKPRTTINDNPVETEYEEVCIHRPLSREPTKCEYDYVYVDRRPPEVPKKPEYDDVGNHKRLSKDPTKLEYDYVYNHRL